MKVDINKTYKTKSGLPVVIYAVYEGQSFGVHGAWQDVGGVWRSRAWMVNGRADIFGNDNYDLVEARPKRVVWVNEYRDHLGFFDTKERADIAANYRIALHRVVLNEDTVWKADAEREGDDE